MAADEDTGELRLLEALPVDHAECRDAAADERDREAEARDRAADGRDRLAEAAERHAPAGAVDLRERRSLAQLRHHAAAERRRAASDRVAAARDRNSAAHDRQMAAVERGDERSAVTAHRLLNSSAVVSMGLTTLEAHWDGLLGTERLNLLQRMLRHASLIDVRLKELAQGR